MNFNKAGMAWVILGCVAVAGCATPVEPGVGDESVSHSVDALGLGPIAGATAVRVERAAGATSFAVSGAPSWKQVAPGVWEDGAQGSQVVFGEEGHAWLVEQTQKRIEEISNHEDITQPHVSEALTHLQSTLDAALDALHQDSALPKPEAASCNVSFYTGPSGAVTSPAIVGAAALAQMVCTGGCVTFTVTSQACCGGLCTAVSSASRSVCATPWTAGSIYGGTGAGAAQVNVTPPNATQTNTSFTCN